MCREVIARVYKIVRRPILAYSPETMPATIKTGKKLTEMRTQKNRKQNKTKKNN